MATITATTQNEKSTLLQTQHTGLLKPPRNVHTTINYYRDPGDGTEHAPSLAGKRATFNQPSVDFDVVVNDITGSEEQFTLDSHGFQLYTHVSKEKEFLDDEQIKTIYYTEIEKLVFDATGATRVHIFDHTIRRPNPTAQDTDDERRPVKRAHIDQSERAAFNHVQRHLGEDAERLSQCRFQILNIWRPIKTIYRDPFAVCASHSIPDEDILPVKLIYPDWVGEPCTILPNTSHAWYYKFEHTREEVLIFKCYEWKKDGRARRVPHAAFVDKEMADREPRQSIEVRALVFYENDTQRE